MTAVDPKPKRSMAPWAPKWQPKALDAALTAAGGRLGQPQSQHWRVLSAQWAIFVFAPIMAIGIFGLCCAAPAVFFSDARSATAYFALGGVAVLALGFGVATLTSPRRAVGVVVFEHGLVHVDGERTQVIGWSEVTNVWRRVTEYYDTSMQKSKTRRTKYHVILESISSSPVHVNDEFTEIEALTDHIVTEVTRRQLPEAVRLVQQGQTLRFGPFGVGPHGIDNGRETLPWSQIRELQVIQGEIRIRKDGKWLSWSRADVGDIPNFFVFFAVAQSLAARE